MTENEVVLGLVIHILIANHSNLSLKDHITYEKELKEFHSIYLKASVNTPLRFSTSQCRLFSNSVARSLIHQKCLFWGKIKLTLMYSMDIFLLYARQGAGG